MEFFIGIVVGSFIGFALCAFLLNRMLSKFNAILREEIEQLTKESGEDTVTRMELEVELDGEIFLCYNKTTKDFVCQGSNLAEIQEHFKSRFPDFDAVIVSGPAEALATIKQQLKDSKHESSSSV